MQWTVPGNLHKWAYTCRGCAVLWVNPSLHDAVLPVVTSFQQLYAANDFRSRFVYNGTCDRTSFYTAKAGLDFIAALGGMVGTTVSLLSNIRAKFNIFCCPVKLAISSLYVLCCLCCVFYFCHVSTYIYCVKV